MHIFEDLPNLVSTTQVCFAPEDRLVVTGTSADRNGEGAALVFIDLSTQLVVRKVAMPNSVVAVHWHPRLNQIFVGTGEQLTFNPVSAHLECKSLIDLNDSCTC